MIHGFTRQSGGHVRTEVGAGTTVRIYLPRNRGEGDEAELLPELAEAPRADSEGRVLVVAVPRIRGAKEITDLDQSTSYGFAPPREDLSACRRSVSETSFSITVRTSFTAEFMSSNWLEIFSSNSVSRRISASEFCWPSKPPRHLLSVTRSFAGWSSRPNPAIWAYWVRSMANRGGKAEWLLHRSYHAGGRPCPSDPGS